MKSRPNNVKQNHYIPLCVPEIRGNEWEYMKDCLDTNWVSSVGSYVDKFEFLLSKYVGSKYSTATSSGTAALHTALLVAGVAPDDEVLVSNLSFIAPANSIRYVGAWPVFIDADPEYWQIDVQKVADFLNTECKWEKGFLYNKLSGRKVTAILPVHIFGHMCDMDPIIEIASKYNLTVIEDSTECLGATYKSRKAGSIGHIACFSFNGNKIITAGGGGMIATNNKDWDERAKYLTTQAKDDPVEYIHHEIGYNYRLSNIQAAMGVAQLELIDEFIAQKIAITKIYNDSFKDISSLTLPNIRPNTKPISWLYTLLLDAETSIDNRRTVISNLNKRNVGARPIWHPLDGLKPYKDCQSYHTENSHSIYRRGVSLPSSSSLSSSDQSFCIDTFKDILCKSNE